MGKRPLISRVPAIWRRLDFQKTLEGFLEAEDNELGRLVELARQIPAMRNPDTVPDRYLRIAGANVGHVWRSDKSFAWNRHRIGTAISRYSYKGTYDRLGDELREIEVDGYHVQDQASRIVTLSRQGALSKSRIVDADFWHEGVFVIYLQDARGPHMDPAELESVIKELKPAGHTWFTVRSFAHAIIYETVLRYSHGQTMWLTDTLNQKIGHGHIDSNMDDSVEPGYRSSGRIQRRFFRVSWGTAGDTSVGRIGSGILGSHTDSGIINGHKSSVRLQRSYSPANWHTEGETGERKIGFSRLGAGLEVSFDGQRFYRPRLPLKRVASEELKSEIQRTFMSVIRHPVGTSHEGKLCDGRLGVGLYLSFTGTRFYNPGTDPWPTRELATMGMVVSEARRTFRREDSVVDVEVSGVMTGERSSSGLMAVAVSVCFQGVIPLNDVSGESSVVETIQRTTFDQSGSVFQGILTTDSNLPVNIDFPANTGHPDNYMTEEEAATQTDIQITTSFIIRLEFIIEADI